MNPGNLEPYVSPEEAAAFLKTNRLMVVRMARSGALPAHGSLQEISTSVSDKIFER